MGVQESPTEFQLVITACTSETVQGSEGSYTAYCLRCVLVGLGGKERKSWEVRRRYSEFHDLHMRMKALGKVHAELPSKNPLIKMSMLRKEIERDRETGLQDYLNCVLERCNDDQCLLLSKFLHVNKHLTSGMVGNLRNSIRSLPQTDAAPSKPEKQQVVKTNEQALNPDLPREGNLGSVTYNLQLHLLDDLKQRNNASTGREAAHTAHRPPQSEQQDAVPSNKDAVPSNKYHAQAQQQKKSGSIPVSDSKEQTKAGVGLFFIQNDSNMSEVDEIIQGSSASADGTIQVGDILLAVDGVSVVGKDLCQARDLIVGPPDSLVSLTFARSRAEFDPQGKSSKEYTVRLKRALKRSKMDNSSVSDVQEGAPMEQKPASRNNSTISSDGTKASMQKVAPRQEGRGPNKVEASRTKFEQQDSFTRLHQEASDQSLSRSIVSREASESWSTVRAICAFEAQRPHELSLKVGEFVVILRKHPSGWWEGCSTRDGRRGWIPSNHVEEIDAQVSRSLLLCAAAAETMAGDRARASSPCDGAEHDGRGGTQPGQRVPRSACPSSLSRQHVQLPVLVAERDGDGELVDSICW
eukprot:751078-Hanusia_phi.AAC.3